MLGLGPITGFTTRRGCYDSFLANLPRRCIGHADRACDGNRIRDVIEDQGAVPNIPPKRNRIWKSCFSKTFSKGLIAIGRMVCRLKDYRRLVIRYDKLAANFLGNIHLAAAIMGLVTVPALDFARHERRRI